MRIFLLTEGENYGIIAVGNSILGCRQAVRHQTLTLASVGSNPAIPASRKGTHSGAFSAGWDGFPFDRAFAKANASVHRFEPTKCIF